MPTRAGVDGTAFLTADLAGHSIVRGLLRGADVLITAAPTTAAALWGIPLAESLRTAALPPLILPGLGIAPADPCRDRTPSHCGRFCTDRQGRRRPLASQWTKMASSVWRLPPPGGAISAPSQGSQTGIVGDSTEAHPASLGADFVCATAVHETTIENSGGPQWTST